MKTKVTVPVETKCNRTLELRGSVIESYYRCDKKPFKQVIYKSATHSGLITEYLCKTHYNALIKNIARINKRTGFEFQLTAQDIHP